MSGQHTLPSQRMGENPKTPRGRCTSKNPMAEQTQWTGENPMAIRTQRMGANLMAEVILSHTATSMGVRGRIENVRLNHNG